MNARTREQPERASLDESAAKAPRSLITEAIIAGAAVLLAFAVSVAYGFDILQPPLAQVLGGGSGFLALIFLGYFYYRSRKEGRHGQPLYEAALAGDTNMLPLAEPQPVPDAAALALPYMFKLRRNWRGMAAYSGASFLCLWVFEGDFFARLFFPHDVMDWLLLTTAVVLASTALMLMIVILIQRQRLEVTESGLFFREGIGPSTLRWEDITLFIIPPGVSKDRPLRRYELVGAGYSWFVLRPSRQRLFQLDRPTLPYDEYDRQMDALVALIAAKTGLPLYDLR